MRLTTKGRFAVTAMVDLALRQTGGIGQSRLTNHEKEHPA